LSPRGVGRIDSPTRIIELSLPTGGVTRVNKSTLCEASFPLDRTEGLFETIDGFLKGLEQSLCVAGAGNDSGVELSSLIRKELTKVEEELERVMADFEIVSVPPFKPSNFSRVISFMIH